MNERERLSELLGSMQRDLLPSLIRTHDEDDLQILHSVMLQVLERRPEPTVKELAGLVGRSESRTSRLVDQLVRRDLVERHDDTADRRAKRIRLSGSGIALLRRLRDVRIDAQMRLWAYMDEDERDVAMHAMEIFAKAARRSRDERG